MSALTLETRSDLIVGSDAVDMSGFPLNVGDYVGYVEKDGSVYEQYQITRVGATGRIQVIRHEKLEKHIIDPSVVKIRKSF